MSAMLAEWEIPNNLSEWVKIRNARGPSTMEVSVCVCVCVRARVVWVGGTCVVFVYEYSCLKIYKVTCKHTYVDVSGLIWRFIQ